jgi:flagellar M-ring protein FliF
MNELIALIRGAGVPRLAALIGLGAGVAIALTLITARLTEIPYGVLYTDIELAEAKAVIDRLGADGVPFKTRERGGRMSILAPQSEIPELRMTLAADGEAPRGGVGYEIFDRDESFGTTAFQQNINRLRALEGELARTIASLDGVKTARVHLVLPERALFAREREEASASIVVDGTIERKAVAAIVNLAASAVPGLKPSKVTVLDAAGALLTSGEGEGGFVGGAAEKTAETEARLRRTLEDILGRVVGAENLRVQVAADIDFNRVTENADLIDPDSQTVLSTTTVEEAADETEPQGGRGVTVANALPGAQTVSEAYPPATSNNRRNEETVNYEMSRTRRTEVREEGIVKRLSVAIALSAGASPRAPEEIARISALARSAAGLSETRGDRLDVVEIAFAPETPAKAPAAFSAPELRENVGRIAEIGALAAIGLALIVFVLRPLFLAPKRSRARIDEAPALPQIAGSSAAGGVPAPTPGAADPRIDIALLQGQAKASSVGKVAEAVKAHTEESAAILKGWIRQAS